MVALDLDGIMLIVVFVIYTCSIHLSVCGHSDYPLTTKAYSLVKYTMFTRKTGLFIHKILYDTYSSKSDASLQY